MTRAIRRACRWFCAITHVGRTCGVAKLSLTLGGLLLVGCSVAAGQTSACRGIHVTVSNIRNNIGTVDCALFDAPEGFPVEVLHFAMRLVVMKIRKTEARCDFEDVPSGTYALVVLHDENMNGKLDTNWLGIPKEGYGFSNNAKASFGRPSFSAASFLYNGKGLDLMIALRY
jgi:uncharacterized protein (DUF2141 family)